MNFTPTYVIKDVITTNIGPLHLENGKVTNTESEMAKVLNDYFASLLPLKTPMKSRKYPQLNLT